VKKVVNDLMKYGNVQRAYLGISYMPSSVIAQLTDDQLKELGVRRDAPGVQVTEVVDNGSAKAAGIKTGDIITKINGVPIPGASQMTEQIARYKPGDKISITYLRNNKEMTSENVVLRNLSGTTDVVKTTTLDKLGADLSPMDKDDARRLGIRGGVWVSAIGNGILKKQTTMAPGFLIIKAGDQTVTSPEELASVLDKKSSVQLIGLYPEKSTNIYYYNIKTSGAASESF
jgi:S1-C subfamily serine protease